MITIIIPTYNRSALLAENAASYQAQAHVTEIIYVDDGSTDDTPAALTQIQVGDSRVRCIRHPHRRGLPAARNSGILAATTEFVLFGEDDAVLAPDYASVLLHHLDLSGAVAGAGRLIYEPSLPTDSELAGPVIDLKTFVGRFASRPVRDVDVPFLHALGLIRTDIAREYLYDDSSYKVNYFREETDFYLRLYSNGHRLIFCPHTYVLHRERPKRGGLPGGVWPRRRIAYAYWRQRNNCRFLIKNRAILKSMLGLDYRRLLISLAATALISQVRETLSVRATRRP